MEACHDAIDDPTDCAVAHDAVDHTRRTERTVAGSTLLSAVRRFNLIAGQLFESFKTMMTPTKTDKRDTVNGDCGYLSLSSSNLRIAHHGAVRWLIRRAQTHLPVRVEEHAGIIPKAISVLSSLGRRNRPLLEGLEAISPSRRGRANLPVTNPSDRLKRFGRTLSAVLPRPRSLCQVTLLVAALALMALAAPGARAANPPDAGTFLTNLNDRAIEQLTAPAIGQEEREDRFRTLLNEGFNIPVLGRFVLGRYWRGADDKERKAFLAVFEDVIVQRFLQIFADYSGERLDIGHMRPDPRNPALAPVSSWLLRPQGEPVKVEWRIRHEGGRYQIADVVVEGVSIAITLRSEYISFIRRHGGDVGALIESLRQKVAAGAFTPKTGETSRLQ